MSRKHREALSDACYAMFNFLKTQYGSCYEEMANALDKAKAALAEPVLNCEVGTPEEQYERWKSNCGHGIPNCLNGCKVYKRATELGLLDERGLVKCGCIFVWAQMSYEEGGADEQK